MQTSKQRHQFYLPDALSAKLEALAAKPGASKTAILTDALAAWLDRAGAAEVDARFAPRLDRLSQAQLRTDDKIDMLTEMLGAFVQHQLLLVAHQPPFDHATRQLGGAKYQSFLDIVGRRVAKRGVAGQLPDKR